MWKKLSHLIIKYRLALIVFLVVVTGFMSYQAQFVKWSFNLVNVVPDEDEDMIHFQDFKNTFGEDGNILAIGIRDSSAYELDKFFKLKLMSDALSKTNGVENVLSLPQLKKISKDRVGKKFWLEPIFNNFPTTQEALDSALKVTKNQKLYSGQLMNEENGATLLLVSIDKKVLNTKYRNGVIYDVLQICESFENATGITLHYGGLPYIRYTHTVKLKYELKLFLVLSVLVTGIILFVFFRSLKAVLVPLLIIGMIVVWVLGTLSLFDFEITLLTGLIPPIIVVIGIPNAVYMINKYHQEYFEHRNQLRALRTIIRRIGIVTFITNFTTAVGFLVLAFTDIIVLKEFGIVAGINILATFIASMILIPAVFSYVSPPDDRHLKHLSYVPLDKILTGLDLLVHRHKTSIFVVTIGIVLICFWGLLKMQAVSFMADDFPEDSVEKQDLYFFEENFSGVLPLEIIVDTKKSKGVQKLSTLRKIDKFETFLDSIDHLSQPVSLVSFIKASRQAYYNDKPSYYALPNSRDKNFILRYLSNQEGNSNLINSFVDSVGQKARISIKMADIGSIKMDSLINEVIEPKIASIFSGSNIDVSITGTSVLFIKGNRFLIDNLLSSMMLAFIVIAFIMAILFRNVKMIIICLIPNVIPLLITAGMMGWAGIALKPSTALIFSIAFGISVDDSIHFLAKYRQELFANNFFVPVAVSKSLRETGSSMIYTSVILFFGFVIFSASEFGGTVALGVLTSTTLLMAMLTNLVLLPALLLRFDSGKVSTETHPLIELYPEFYHEDEDEEIDLDMITIAKK